MRFPSFSWLLRVSASRLSGIDLHWSIVQASVNIRGRGIGKHKLEREHSLFVFQT